MQKAGFLTSQLICKPICDERTFLSGAIAGLVACFRFLSGDQFEGDLGEILALGAEISPYIGLGEKWESP